MKNSKAMRSIAFFVVVGKVRQYMRQTFAKALNGKRKRAKAINHHCSTFAYFACLREQEIFNQPYK
jgi:hypothetical protein